MSKILWLAHRDPLNPRAGGAERTIFEVGTRLINKGHTVILISGGWKGCKSIENFHGIEIHRFGKNIGPHLALLVILLKYNFDIIVNDLGHAVPWFFPTILNKHNIVFFRHLHARSLPGQVNPIIAKFITAIEKCYFILYHNSPFITESNTSRDDLQKLGIKGVKIIMNPPGVDQTLFYPTPKLKDPTLVYFGGMRKYKRPLEVLYLLKILIDKLSNIKLYIIGKGPEESKMKQLTYELKLQKYVEFKGRVSSKELSVIVSSSWLNLHTSVTEGWGLSILEASAAGTPTVAYDVPGVRDSVENGLNGIKVKDGDIKALADASFLILSDNKRWISSSVIVAQKYSWDKTAQLWDKLIMEIIEGYHSE